MDPFDVVCIGNAKVDIFLQIHDTNKHFRLDLKTGELCIKSGDKATVDSADFMVGGNAANVSIGITRMGFKSSIVAEIGSDEFADKIINTLNSEKVSEKFLKKTQKASSFSVILNFKKERTIFEEHVEREHNFSFDNLYTQWIYLTSMGDKWHDAYKKTLDYVLAKKVKLAFNPGSKQLENIDEIEEILKISEILFLNKEEAAKICSVAVTNGDNFVRELILQIKNKGAKIVVITDGVNGSSLIDDQNNIISQKAIDANIVEKTGAGDAFASGFLSGVMSGVSFKDAMEWGSLNASSVISMVGAQRGLLTRDKLDEQLRINTNLKTENI